MKGERTAKALEALFIDSSSRGYIVMGRPHDKKSIRTQRGPLTSADWLAHAQGRCRVGAIPFTGEGQQGARWGCIDLDTAKGGREGELSEAEARERIRGVLRFLEAHHVTGHVEASKSRGYHVWLFLDRVVPADSVRSFLLAAVHSVDPAWARESDAVTPRGKCTSIGNGVWAPLCGADQESRTRWIESATWLPFDAQTSRTKQLHNHRSLGDLVEAFEPPPELRALAGEPSKKRSPGRLSIELGSHARALLELVQVLRDYRVLDQLKLWKVSDRIRLQCPFHAHQEGHSVDNAVFFANGNFACMSCGKHCRGPYHFILELEKQNGRTGIPQQQ